jgi:hypothetical protein
LLRLKKKKVRGGILAYGSQNKEKSLILKTIKSIKDKNKNET